MSIEMTTQSTIHTRRRTYRRRVGHFFSHEKKCPFALHEMAFVMAIQMPVEGRTEFPSARQGSIAHTRPLVSPHSGRQGTSVRAIELPTRFIFNNFLKIEIK